MRTLAVLLERSVAQASRLLLAVFALLVGFQLLIVIQASSYERSQSFSRIAELMPGYLQRGLGNLALLLASFPGMVTAGYFHPVIVVMLALLAAYLATEPAHEVETGLVDLVLARPVPRHHLVTRSLLLMVGTVLAAVVAMCAGTWAGLRLFADPAWDWPGALTMLRLVAHLAAVAICRGAFSLAVASGAQRRATAFALAAVTTVVAYLVAFLAISWAPAKVLAWMSPFYYYPAVGILADVSPHFSNLLVLTSAATAFVALAYWRFARREL